MLHSTHHGSPRTPHQKHGCGCMLNSTWSRVLCSVKPLQCQGTGMPELPFLLHFRSSVRQDNSRTRLCVQDVSGLSDKYLAALPRIQHHDAHKDETWLHHYPKFSLGSKCLQSLDLDSRTGNAWGIRVGVRNAPGMSLVHVSPSDVRSVMCE